MNRSHITVVLKPAGAGLIERRLDANGLLLGMDNSLTFLCSGVPNTVAAEEVARIEWNEEGAGWCPQCDGSCPGVEWTKRAKST